MTILKTKPPKDCSCQGCVAACEHKPGWFVPGQVEKVAEFLHISVKELFKKYLTVDWWQNGGDPDDIFLLAPATVRNGPGGQMPYNPLGKCIFLKEGKCSIHPVKPLECKMTSCTEEDSASRTRHRDVGLAWKDHQKQIEELLGHKPEAPEPRSMSESLGLFL